MLNKALEYIRNTNGGATLMDFMDDHDPIGPQLWRDITAKGFAIENANGQVILTNAGSEALKG